MTASRRLLAGVLMLELGAAGCGRRGSPQPPIRPVPGPVADLSARRVGDRVEIRFSVPTENTDRSTPPDIARVEIYAVPGPPIVSAPAPAMIPMVPFSLLVNGLPVPLATSADIVLSRFPPVQLSEPPGAAKPTTGAAKAAPVVTAAAEIMAKKYFRGAVDVRLPPAPGKDAAEPAAASGASTPQAPPAPAAEDPRPLPGWKTVYAEQIPAERAAGIASRDRSILRYVLVGVTRSKRRGTPSPVVEVPLGMELAAPSDLNATYDATTLKLTWTPGAPAQTFRVYRADRDGKEEPAPLNSGPLSTPAFSTPVVFDEERCYVVRAVLVRGPASVESDASSPLCLTAVDTFPPPAPTGLTGLPTENQVQLLWSPVVAADLAGYLVLRGENGGALQPLMDEPITDTTYTDARISPGVRYTYAVIAIDKAGNPGGRSNQIDEIR